ncbi:MAG TPA: TonB family protein [Pyrinomonadaceae bacterium]|nr:TonB family protein [Pyrinomonadaceae bacterium]
MKRKLFLLVIASVCFAACDLFWSTPSSVVKKLMANAESGNVDGMMNLWSKKTLAEEDAGAFRESAHQFVALLKQARERGEHLRIEKLRETVQGDRARVFYLYRDSKGVDSVGMGFALIKEEGKWKLYRGIDIGEEDKPFDTSFGPRKSAAKTPSAEPEVSPTEMVAPPPPPASSNAKNGKSQEANSNSSAKSAAPETISGGVLNGKATRLPQPAYPAAAKAVKASGPVTVQVLVDENGSVLTADATSGHPLLRSSAEQAARIAHFRPTVLDGKAVKVKGTITYQFSP